MTQEYGPFIRITALILFVQWLVERINEIRKKIKLNKQRKRRILDLDQSEKAVLREFDLQGRNTIELPEDDPAVAGLLESGLLQLVSRKGRISSAGRLFNMKRSDFAFKNLPPEMLGIPIGEPTEEEISFLHKNRPEFVHSIQSEKSLSDW